MELRQLRYFIVLAKELHFARAAEILAIAQPSLSVQIQALEAALGTKLFTRGPRAVRLTPAGALFLEEARLTLAQADRALAVGRRAGRGELGSIRIGLAVASSLSGVPSTILSRYRKRYPEIEIQLSIMSTNRQLEALGRNNLDAGFTVHPSMIPEGLELVSLCAERLMVAVGADHRLASKSDLNPKDLAAEPFLVVHPDISTGIYQCTLRVGEQGGFTPRITRIERDLMTLLSLVGAGFGVVILSESVRLLAVPNVEYRSLRGVTETIEMVAAFRQDDAGVAIRAFRDMCIAGAELETKQIA
jgi:DNA-binding transcriptional LysR family regulator